MDRPPPRLGDLIDDVMTHHPGADPLPRLGAAAAAAQHLAEVGDHLVGHFVDQARRAGTSWAMIGEAMGGVSKQAAQQRFTTRSDEAPIGDGHLARFTARARLVLATAEMEAGEVQPIHLLAALVAEEGGLAVRAVTQGGVRLPALRRAVAAATPPPPEDPTGRVRYSPAGRKVIGLAERESLRLGHAWVGTEHLLLALLAEPGTGAHAVLTRLGLEHADVETTVLAALEDLRAARRDG